MVKGEKSSVPRFLESLKLIADMAPLLPNMVVEVWMGRTGRDDPPTTSFRSIAEGPSSISHAQQPIPYSRCKSRSFRSCIAISPITHRTEPQAVFRQAQRFDQEFLRVRLVGLDTRSRGLLLNVSHRSRRSWIAEMEMDRRDSDHAVLSHSAVWPGP